MECTDDLHKTLAGHRHDDPSSDSGAEVWEDCWCPIQFVRPDPTPEPWAGHPIKWCEEHAGLAEPDEAECPRADLSGFDYRFEAPCQFTAYQPWADLLAERDAALQVMNEHRCGEQAERAYRRTLRAEDGRDEARKERDVYKRAKAENDDRFMIERDEARAERDEARKELAALRVLDGASAERAEAERKAMAQQRDDACRERKQYKREANAARRERNKVRKELARAIAPWTDEEVARPCESGNWGAPSLNERIMRERGFRDE